MYLDTDAFQDLCSAADPYSFFDRYQGKWKMPIDAVNDEFFMPDDEMYVFLNWMNVFCHF